MVDEQKARQAIALLLEAIGEDAAREGLEDTPKRVGHMYAELFSGLDKDAEKELECFYSKEYDGLILVKDIFFHSMCEHHLLPFFGKAHVAYIPQAGMITGLGKLASTVEIFARRPQIQERLTAQIADVIEKKLKPAGVIVMIEAEHLCMSMRGVMKPGAITSTLAVRGVYADDQAARAEVLALIKR